jgi:hypothetical protein
LIRSLAIVNKNFAFFYAFHFYKYSPPVTVDDTSVTKREVTWTSQRKNISGMSTTSRMAAESSNSSRSSAPESPEASRTQTNQTARTSAKTKSEEKPSLSAKVKAIWAKSDLDLPTFLMMMKSVYSLMLGSLLLV